MPTRTRRRNGRVTPASQPRERLGRRAWLAPIFGATLIVCLGAAASLAQATTEVFVAASIVFSLAEGVVLAFVGYLWSRRGVGFAVVAACMTAMLAAPGRWEFVYARYGRTIQTSDMVTDLLVTLAWGAFAGLAGATVLRTRIAALTHSNEERFRERP
jgi:hypothetical protein